MSHIMEKSIKIRAYLSTEIPKAKKAWVMHVRLRKTRKPSDITLPRKLSLIIGGERNIFCGRHKRVATEPGLQKIAYGINHTHRREREICPQRHREE